MAKQADHRAVFHIGHLDGVRDQCRRQVFEGHDVLATAKAAVEDLPCLVGNPLPKAVDESRRLQMEIVAAERLSGLVNRALIGAVGDGQLSAGGEKPTVHSCREFGGGGHVRLVPRCLIENVTCGVHRGGQRFHSGGQPAHHLPPFGGTAVGRSRREVVGIGALPGLGVSVLDRVMRGQNALVGSVGVVGDGGQVFGFAFTPRAGHGFAAALNDTARGGRHELGHPGGSAQNAA